MYTIYIPKYRGDRPDYNIIRVISKYMALPVMIVKF